VMTKADTGRAPHASVSGGSSTVYSMGGAVKEAAADLRGTILKRAAQELEVDVSRLRLSDDGVHAIDQPDKTCQLASLYRMETDIFIAKYPPFVGRGSRLSKQAAPCFAGSLAEVTVDPETGKVTVTRLVTAQDVGKAINPMSVEGQIQGGGCQSIGAGLWEEVVYGTEGRVTNADLLDYRMPTSADVPMIETILIEQPGGDGPYGAKGVGEPPIIAPAAAVANAIADAIGLRITDLPITPERIWRAMSDAGGSDGE
jgi:CO/xanthine dehydrogenase Mo-binding subunit